MALDAAIAALFAARGKEVRVCQSNGEGDYRLLSFLTADGMNLGSVRSADLLDAPDHLAVGLISSWVG